MLKNCFMPMLLSVFILICNAHAQDHENLELVNTFSSEGWNVARDLVLFNDHAYVATEHTGLQVLNISDPAYPYPVDSFSEPPGSISHVENSDSTLFVSYIRWADSTQMSFLSVFDISDPETLDLKSVSYVNPEIRGMFCSDDFLYVISKAPDDQDNMMHYLQIYDVSHGYQPELAGVWETNRAIWDVFVKEDFAYVLGGGGFYIIDVSDSGDPVECSRFELENCKDSYVNDQFLFLRTQNLIVIIEVSDPENPQVISETALREQYNSLFWQEDIVVQDDYAYLAFSVPVGRSGCRSYLEKWDIADPTNPEYVCASPVWPWQCPYRLILRDDYAFVATVYGMRIIDVSDPENLELTGSYNSCNQFKSICISDEFAVTGGSTGLYEGGLYFWDMNLADHSVPASFLEVQGSCLELVGDIVYLSGTTMLEVSDPHRPQIIDGINVAAFRSSLQGDCLYLLSSGEPYSMNIVNVEDPRNPSLISSIELDYRHIYNFYVSENTAYIAAGNDGLLIINVTDAEQPQIISEFDVDENIVDLVVSDATAFIASKDTGILTVDFTDVNNPEIISRYAMHRIEIIEKSGDYVFTGESVRFVDYLKMIDISDPEHPFEAGYYGLQMAVKRIYMKDSLIYVTNYGGEAYVIENMVLHADEYASSVILPQDFSIQSIYPNPFNSMTTISYFLPAYSEASLWIYDMSGRLVNVLTDGKNLSGNHSLIWDGSGLPTGVYHVALRDGKHHSAGNIQKLMLIK